MTNDPRVEELLEELLDSGGTPEEVCRTSPELLGQVRAGWQRLRALEAEVGALFPEPTSVNGFTPPTPPATDLPRIRGYEVQAVLGCGGVGVVYKAWHLRLTSTRRPEDAPGRFLPCPAGGPGTLPYARRRRSPACSPRQHRASRTSVGDLDGRPYFTMEFVEGGSLAQQMAGAPQPVRTGRRGVGGDAWPTPFMSLTKAALSTAISSRRMSCSPTTARRRSPTSVSPDDWTRRQ